MRELDLDPHTGAHFPAPETGPDAGGSPAARSALRIAILGNGRAGQSLVEALSSAGHAVAGPFGRGESLPTPPVELVFICVPDGAISDVAMKVPEGPLLAHCSGASGTELFEGREGLCLHPLMTLSGRGDDLRGAWAAVDGTTESHTELAESLARSIGMTPVRIAQEDRAAYHAAASIASNMLVTLEAAAEELAATAGLPREALGPLVARTASNLAEVGPQRALTGPIARGDMETVNRQRAEIESRTPHLLEMFDALCQSTERIARMGTPA